MVTEDGIDLMIGHFRCTFCRHLLHTSTEGMAPPMPGPLPGDVKCPECGQWHNAFGQAINDPDSWDPMDAGERWDEEDW